MSSTRTRRVTTATLAVAAGAAPLMNAAAATAQDATSVQTTTPQVSTASAGITDAINRALPVTGTATNLAPQMTSLTNLGTVQNVVEQALPANSVIAGTPLDNLPVTGALQQGASALTGNLAGNVSPIGRSSLEAQNLEAQNLPAQNLPAQSTAANTGVGTATTPIKTLSNIATPVAGSASGLASQLPGVGGLTSGLPGGSLGNVVPDVSSLGNVTSAVPGLSAVKGVAGSLPVAGALKSGPLAAVAGSVAQF
jgi:hypothetical protein